MTCNLKGLYDNIINMRIIECCIEKLKTKLLPILTDLNYFKINGIPTSFSLEMIRCNQLK